MPTTFNFSDARNDLSKIFEFVASTGTSVTINKYSKPLVTIFPAKKEEKKNWDKIIGKYAGMWSGSEYDYWDDIAKGKYRRSRKTDFWK